MTERISTNPIRFGIRDLLWLTVAIALGLGWWLDHRALTERCDWLWHRFIQYSKRDGKWQSVTHAIDPEQVEAGFRKKWQSGQD